MYLPALLFFSCDTLLLSKISNLKCSNVFNQLSYSLASGPLKFRLGIYNLEHSFMHLTLNIFLERVI